MELRIAIIGFMASGKSTVGPLLAQQLGYRFVDLDQLIEERTSQTIERLFDRGELEFRAAETEALYHAASLGAIVLAAGGGAPIPARNREVFRQSFRTFFLEVGLQEALWRAGPPGSRPLLRQPLEQIEALFQQRLPVYRSIGVAMATHGRPPLQVAEEIVDWLRRFGFSPANDAGSAP